MFLRLTESVGPDLSGNLSGVKLSKRAIGLFKPLGYSGGSNCASAQDKQGTEWLE